MFRFRYHIKESKGSQDKALEVLKPTLADFKVAFLEMWPIIAVYACCIVGANMDNISNLIVSEFHGDGTAWSGKV